MHIRGSSIYFTVVGLTSTTGVLAAVQPWGQCGGMGFTGETACAQGWSCKEYNSYYSQCVEGAGNAASSAPAQTAVPTSAAPVPSVNATTAVAIPTTLATKIVSSAKVADASSVVVVSSTKAVPTAAANLTHGESCSLDAVLKAKGKKYIGVAADKGTLSSADTAAIVKSDFGQVTPENRYVLLPIRFQLR